MMMKVFVSFVFPSLCVRLTAREVDPRSTHPATPSVGKNSAMKELDLVGLESGGCTSDAEMMCCFLRRTPPPYPLVCSRLPLPEQQGNVTKIFEKGKEGQER